MTDALWKTLIDETAVMALLMMLRYVFGANLKLNLKGMAITAGIYLVFGFLCNMLGGSLGGFLSVIIFTVGVFFVVCKAKRWKIFLYLIPCLMLYNHTTLYARLLCRAFGKELVYEYADLSLLVILVIWAVWVDYKRLKFSMNFWECSFITVYSYMSNFYSDVSDMIAKGTLPEKDAGIYQVMWFAFVTIINACVIVAIVFRKRHAYQKQMAGMYQQYFEQEYRGFQEKSERQKEQDRMRHDWKNHINTVQAMWEKGEADQAVQYVAGLVEENTQNNYTILSGNQVADAILNLKCEKAEKMGIDFQFQGNLAKLSCLEPMDISVLLGNALDNALEACGEGEQPSFIRIVATENKGFLLVTVENTLHKPIVLRDNRPVTTKKHASEHGYGVLGMEHVARKYKGELRFEIVENMFKVQVMLPIVGA